MWWLALGACDGTEALVRTWHRSFAITRAQTAQETDGACDPALDPGGTDAPYGFLAVSAGVPDVASLYLCDGPTDADCPLQPVGSIWIREWTDTVLAGETGVDSVFGDLCSMSWNGIDAERTADGDLHVELRVANREVTAEDAEACDDALEDLIRSSCDSVLVLDGHQQ